jgi:sugar phosphate isomerase/epimerase
MRLPIDRRDFLKCAAGACLAATRAPAAQDLPSPEICVFAKPLQWMSPDELAAQLAQWQVTGIEATLRGGGQIEPEKIPAELPRLVEVLARHQQRIVIAATDIDHVAQPLTEPVLKAFAKAGIDRYRLAFRHYDLTQPLLPQLDRFAADARELAQLNASLGLRGLFQNHAGPDYLGAPLWDLAQVLHGIDSQHLGIAFDVRHTAIEAGQSWPIDYRLVRPMIGAVYCKDARWEADKVVDVPLGDGPVARGVFAQVRADGIPGPISLHMEYVDHRQPELLPQSIAAITRDLATLRGWLA